MEHLVTRHPIRHERKEKKISSLKLDLMIRCIPTRNHQRLTYLWPFARLARKGAVCAGQNDGRLERGVWSGISSNVCRAHRQRASSEPLPSGFVARNSRGAWMPPARARMPRMALEMRRARARTLFDRRPRRGGSRCERRRGLRLQGREPRSCRVAGCARPQKRPDQ